MGVLSIIFLPELVFICLHSDSSKANDDTWYTWLFGPFLSLMGSTSVISASAIAAHRVPSVGGYDDSRDYPLILIGCLSGILFGGVHYLGWNFVFQTHTEQILWRASSLAVTGALAAILLLGTVVVFAPGFLSEDTVLKFHLCMSFIYVPARFILVGLMALSMRSPPTAIYDTVAWTTYVPHFLSTS